MATTKQCLERALNIADLRTAARKRLAHGIYAFLERGVEDDLCVEANRASFGRIKLLPRVLRDVSRIDTGASLLGRDASMPVAIAPTGGNAMLWYQGDVALARAAAAAGIPFTISTVSSIDVEQIAAAGARLWFQLYLWADRGLSLAAMDRAAAAGCDTLFLTVDMPVSPNREFMRRTGFGTPFRIGRRNAVDVLSHPRWALGVVGRYMLDGGMPRQANLPPELKGRITQDPGQKAPFRNDNLDWDEVRSLRERWHGTFIVKGILRPEDAETALSIGADGVVVSNHGGRSMDCSIAAIDALPAVASVVGAKGTVLLDSGIQRGTDIVKALALGADGVLIGRAALYGLAVGGEAGVGHALALLKAEIVRTMAMTGSRNIAEITRDLVA